MITALSSKTAYHQPSSKLLSFGQIGTSPLSALDYFSNGLQFVSGNRLNDLIISDMSGMVLPRSIIEWKERGFDMFRETIFREMGGVVSNVFMVGWMGYLLLQLSQGKLLNNGLWRANLSGVYQGAWIHSKTLDYFANTFASSLKETKTPEEARTLFLKQVFGSLQASDRHQAAQALEQARHIVDNNATGHQSPSLNRLSERLFNGRLEPAEIDHLVKAFTQNADANQPVFNLYQALISQRETLLKDTSFLKKRDTLVAKKPLWLIHAAKKTGQSDVQIATNHLLEKFLTPERIKQSKIALKQGHKVLEGRIKDKLIAHGLSDSVHFVDKTGKIQVRDRDLTGSLKEIKYFMEQYVDRVLHNPKTGQLFTPADITQQFRDLDHYKQHIMTRLTGNHRTGWFKNWFTHPLDGLVTATQKSKNWLILCSMALTIGFGISIAFLNNWLTRNKHHGKTFFPGEKALEEQLIGGQFRTATSPTAVVQTALPKTTIPSITVPQLQKSQFSPPTILPSIPGIPINNTAWSTMAPTGFKPYPTYPVVTSQVQLTQKPYIATVGEGVRP